MKAILVAKRSYSNACALIELLPSGQVQVRGKFYEGVKSFDGPEVITSQVPSPPLIGEMAIRETWASPKSEELKKFCNSAYAEAKKENPTFFSYE